MGGYIARRLILAIPTLIIITVIVGSLIRLVPGDVIMAKVGDTGNPAAIEAAREDLGLNKPFPQQLGEFFFGLVTGNPEKSLYTRKPVQKEFARALPVTVELGLLAIIISVVIAIPLGVLSAVRADTWVDHVARLFAITGLATPDFWLATVLVVYMALWLDYLPPAGFDSILRSPITNLNQLALPSLILGYRLAGITIRMMRSTMLDVMNQDYVRTARAKGLTELTVLSRHAMRNAMIPVTTIIGVQVSFILGGSVILEAIFGLPGVGLLTFTAIQQRDYTQIQFNVVVLASMLVLTNLLVDLLYGFLDPRIRYG